MLPICQVTLPTLLSPSGTQNFIEVDPTLEVNEVVSSVGVYVEFRVTRVCPRDGKSTISGDTDGDRSLPSVLDVVMSARTSTNLPEKYETTKNKKFEMKNAVIDWHSKNKVGWEPGSVEGSGWAFVNTVSDVMWDLDGKHESLAARAHGVPQELGHLQGYNCPEKHRHKRKHPGSLSCDMLAEHSGALLNLTQMGYMKAEKWTGIRAVLLKLAVHLRDHESYLNSQNSAMQVKSLSFSDSGAFKIMQPSLTFKPGVVARYRSLHRVIQATADYMIHLNDHAPV